MDCSEFLLVYLNVLSNDEINKENEEYKKLV